jgi:hypothetical protein
MPTVPKSPPKDQKKADHKAGLKIHLPDHHAGGHAHKLFGGAHSPAKSPAKAGHSPKPRTQAQIYRDENAEISKASPRELSLQEQRADYDKRFAEFEKGIDTHKYSDDDFLKRMEKFRNEDESLTAKEQAAANQASPASKGPR